MAVIQSQLEFHNSYLNHARPSNYADLNPLSVSFQVDTSSFGLPEIVISILGDTRINSYVQPNSFGVSSQVGAYSFGLPEIAGSLNYCVVSWASLLSLKGIGVQDYLSTHARFFGVNFRQDTEKIYIKKPDLPQLITEENNTGQSLLIALLLRVLVYESNDLISLVNIYRWNTFFVNLNQVPMCLTVLIVEVNVPAKYKYVDVEIMNANTDFSPNEL